MKHKQIAKLMIANRLDGMIPAEDDVFEIVSATDLKPRDYEKISKHFVEETERLVRWLRRRPIPR